MRVIVIRNTVIDPVVEAVVKTVAVAVAVTEADVLANINADANKGTDAYGIVVTATDEAERLVTDAVVDNAQLKMEQ